MGQVTCGAKATDEWMKGMQKVSKNKSRACVRAASRSVGSYHCKKDSTRSKVFPQG